MLERASANDLHTLKIDAYIVMFIQSLTNAAQDPEKFVTLFAK